MNTPVIPGAFGGPADPDERDEGDLTAFRVGALTSQSDIDKFKNTRGVAFAASYMDNETGWDGLTKSQEAAAQERRHIEELEEDERQTLKAYQETLDRLYERRAEVEREIERERENAALLSNGKRAFKGDDGDPNYYYENGDRITDPKLIKEAQEYDAAHGGTMTKQSAIKKSKEQEIDLDHQINATTNEMNNYKKASGVAIDSARSGQNPGTVISDGVAAAQSNGQAADAMIAAQKATYDQVKLQATNQVIGKVDSNRAAIAAVTTNGQDDDFYSMAEDTGDSPDKQSAAITTTRNTTLAAQQFGATSDLSSKSQFAAASAPASIAGATPDITQQNNGSTQRSPTTPTVVA